LTIRCMVIVAFASLRLFPCHFPVNPSFEAPHFAGISALS
jgi:hypothetical protein